MYSRVAISTWSTVCHGPPGLISSVFEQADHRLGQCVVERVADRADRGIDPGGAADAAVVGSSIVKEIEKHIGKADLVENVAAFAAWLKGYPSK